MRSIFVVISIFLLISSITNARAATIQELEAKLNELRSRDVKLQARAQEFRLLVEETRKEIVGIKQEIRGLSYEINDLQLQIERTQNEIELTNLQIEKLGLEVLRALEQIDIAKVQTGEVLKTLYQAEQISKIELVLSGDDFSDFWSQHQYLSSFQTSLNNLIYQMEVLKDDLEVKQEEQEVRRRELKNLEEQRKIQQGILADKRDYQKVLLSQNEIEQQEYQKNLTQAERDRRRLIEEILRIEEEVKRLRNFEFYLKSGKVPSPGTKLFAWPTKSRTITQGYGQTAFARSGVAGYRFHNGIDIEGGAGTAIYVAAPGNVIGKNTTACPNYGRLRNFGCQGGWGNWLAVKHPNDLVTLYAHMAEPSSLPLGKEVEVGETLGFIGASGNVTGPHLHFSVYTEFFLVPAGYPGYNPEGTLNPLLYL